MSIMVSIGALELCTNVMDFMGERILIAAGGLRLFCGLMFASLLIFVACKPGIPSAPELNNSQNQWVLSKVVVVGASFTAGFQSSGNDKS